MITVQVEHDSVSAVVAAIRRKFDDLTPAMKAVAGLLEDKTAQNFDAESGPLGKWPAIKRPKNHRRIHPRILRDTGRLVASVTTRHTSSTAEIGSNVVYAAIHHFGGEIAVASRSQQLFFHRSRSGDVGRLFVSKKRSNFAQWATIGAHTIRIHPRPYLPFFGNSLQPGLEAAIVAELRRYLSSHAA
ncbi:MAG TPA: phage virion morphogenesis protein [Pseudomonadota bacterium]|nr:phage virion morphogenesis protein [Pseudomonadota bacterium]